MNRFIALLALWRRRSRMRQDLARLDARALRDAAIDPGTADFEAAQPFWIPSAPLRDLPAAKAADIVCRPPAETLFNGIHAITDLRRVSCLRF